MCRDRIVALFGPGQISPKWPKPSQATLSASPGCDYLIHQLHMPDPVPPMTAEQIDLARAGVEGQLADSLKWLPGALQASTDMMTEEGVARDIGAYSVEQRAIGLFQIESNLYPEILIDANPAKFDEELAALDGAASCLNPQDKTTLHAQLQNMRAVGLSHAKLLSTQKDDLDKQWVDALTRQADKVVAQDRSKFDLNHLWGRLRCDGASLGDPSQCMKYDYENVATPGKPVEPQIYASRLRWIRDELPEAVAPIGGEADHRYDSILRQGRGAGEDPSCVYASCSGLHNAYVDVRKQQDAIVSNDPLLEEATGRTEQRQECGSDPAERNVGTVRMETLTSPFHDAYEESACQRKQTLADVLHSTSSPLARLSYAHNAARQMHQEGIDRIKDLCGKKNGLIEEGQRGANVRPLAAGFLKCGDVGEYTKTCADRRSYAKLMCRMYHQSVADENTRQYHQMFQGMAMAAGGALAILATAGGAAVVAGALGLGMSTTSVLMRHEEINASQANYESARGDFMAKLGDRDATRAAWSRMDDAQRFSVAGDIFDAASALLDVHALTGALREANTAANLARASGRVALADQVLQSDADVTALAKVRVGRTAEQTLAEVKSVAGTEAAGQLLEDMRANLRNYGPAVDVIPEAQVAKLQDLESQVRRLVHDGVIDADGAAALRRQISDALGSPEKMAEIKLPRSGGAKAGALEAGAEAVTQPARGRAARQAAADVDAAATKVEGAGRQAISEASGPVGHASAISEPLDVPGHPGLSLKAEALEYRPPAPHENLRSMTSAALKKEGITTSALEEQINEGGMRRVFAEPQKMIRNAEGHLIPDPAQVPRVIKVYDPVLLGGMSPSGIAHMIQRELAIEDLLKELGIPFAKIDRSPAARALWSRGIIIQDRVIGHAMPEYFRGFYKPGVLPQVDALLAKIKNVDKEVIRVIEEKYGVGLNVNLGEVNAAGDRVRTNVGIDVGSKHNNIYLDSDNNPILIDW
jgi:hypothetical protein